MLPVETPFKIYTGLTGQPLNNGYVYFGVADQNPITSPITVYWDAAGTQPAAQPLRTVNGYIVRAGTPANVFVGVSYSELVKDSTGQQVFYARNSDDFSIGTAIINYIASLAATSGSTLIGWIRNAADAVATTVSKWMERQQHNVFDFMTAAEIADVQSMTPVLDHTTAILAYKAFALDNLPCTMVFPRGWYRYSDIGNFAYAGLSLKGYSHRETIMQSTGAAVPALLVDAFEPGLTANDATAPFVQQTNVENITFQASNTATNVIKAQGVARSAWRNVYARNCEPTAGVAVIMSGCMLNSFYNLGCSTNMDSGMSSIPYEGLRVTAGTRDGVNVGNSSNNTFVNPYFEGLSIGMRLAGADQNTFVSGSSEANSVYDLLVAAGSRYNTLIGMGFESGAALTANISDGGTYTKYLNCYANKSVLLSGTGIEVSGGFFHRMEMQSTAVKCRVHNIHVKQWESTFPGTGGFVVHASAVGIEWKSLYDANAAAYIYPLKARTGIVTGASPFQWQNTTGQYVEVIIQTGTVTQIRTLRGGDGWLCPVAIPGRHLLAPSDTIEISWSVSPGISYVPHNSFQG